jgi:uncharacterized membrane protein (UPF0127 family)
MRLFVDGTDVASVDTARSSWQKMKGLLGRTGIEGALYFEDVPSVHTFFMRFTIDVAFLDSDLVVKHVQTMKPWRISGRHNGVRHVLEAQAGSFNKWNLQAGSHLVIKETSAEGPVRPGFGPR